MEERLFESWDRIEEEQRVIQHISVGLDAPEILHEAVDNQTLRNFRKFVKQGERVVFDVDSTAISRVEYDPKKLELIITFPDSREYIYYNVRPRRVERLMRADSHGSFFFYNIRTSFDYEEI